MGNGVVTPAPATSRESEKSKSKSKERRRNSFRDAEDKKKVKRRASTGGTFLDEEQLADVQRIPGKSQVIKLGVEEVSQLIGGLGPGYAPYIPLFFDQQVDGEFLCRLAGTEIDSVMEIMGINDGKRLFTPLLPVTSFFLIDQYFSHVLMGLAAHKHALKFLLEVIQWLNNSFGRSFKDYDSDNENKKEGGNEESIPQLDIIMRTANALFTLR